MFLPDYNSNFLRAKILWLVLQAVWNLEPSFKNCAQVYVPTEIDDVLQPKITQSDHTKY